jgi:hypothetical protein
LLFDVRAPPPKNFVAHLDRWQLPSFRQTFHTSFAYLQQTTHITHD